MAATIGTAYVQVKPDPRSISEFQRAVQSRIGAIRLNVDQSRGAFAPLGKISADLNQFQNSLDASVARTLAFGASVGVIGGAVRSIKAVISSFIEVEKAVADINAVFKLTAPELKGFTSGLFDVARDTAQSFGDVAKAATEFSRQGLSVGETLKRTESAMKLVRLAGLETTQAVNVLTAAMNGFSSAGLESEEIVNKLATVDAAYAVSSSDLALALSRAGDTAQGAKVSFDELLGAVTAVQQRTARGGAVIGNGLKSILTRVQRSKVQSALEDVGVATKDADGNIRESMLVLADYAKIYDTLSDSQRAYTDEQIAGVYQINTLKALVRDMANEYGVYNNAVRTSTEATDEAEKRMAALSQTTDAKLKRLGATFEEFASSGGKDVFKPLLDRILGNPSKLFAEFTKAISAEEKGGWGKLFSGVLSGVGDFLAGPALIKGLGTAYKLVKFLGKEALTAAREVAAMGSAAQTRLHSQRAILGLLQNDSTLVAQIASGTFNTANANKLIESSLTRQLQLSERIAAFQKNVGAFVASNPAIIKSHAAQLGGKARGLADGYAPALRNEKRAISQGVGGARSGDKPVVIPEFNYGGGKRGPAVAHTGEWFVPHFNGGSAIFNRDMAESYGLPSGAVRVGMAEGHIPNFAYLQKYPNRVKMLGEGAFGQFFQHKDARRSLVGAKSIKNDLGDLVPKGMSSTAFRERLLRAEYEESKRAHEALIGSPIVSAPKVFGGLEGSLRRGYVAKEVVKKGDIRELLNNLERHKRFQRLSPSDKSNVTNIIKNMSYAAYDSAAALGVKVGDPHLKNIGWERGDILGAAIRGLEGVRGRMPATIGGGLLNAVKKDEGVRRVLKSIDYNDLMSKSGVRMSLLDTSYGSPIINASDGHVPNFVSFFKARQKKKFLTENGKRIFDPTYELTGKPADHPLLSQVANANQFRNLDAVFDALDLKRPKIGLIDKLALREDIGKRAGQLSGIKGLYLKSGSASFVSTGMASSSSDLMTTVLHETAHDLDARFASSPRGKALGIKGKLSENTRFKRVVENEYKKWRKLGADADIPLESKKIFASLKGVYKKANFYEEYMAQIFPKVLSRATGPAVANLPAVRVLQTTLFGSKEWPFSMAAGYDPLGQAISRESDAVGSGKVRVGVHPSLKAPHNPMGIGVYNSSEGSLSNGIRMARAVGIDPKTKGMAEGHVPNFAKKISLDNRLDDALATFRMRLQEAGDDMKKRNLAEKDYAKTLNRIRGDAEKRASGAPKAGSATNREEFNQLGVKGDAIRAVKRADKLIAGLERREFDTYGRSEPPRSGGIPMRARSVDDPTPRRNVVPVSAPLYTREYVAGVNPSVSRASRWDRAKEKAKRGYARAFSYTEEEKAKGKGQGRFGQSFGFQIAGGLIGSMGEGKGGSFEQGTKSLASGINAAATAMILIPGPAGMVTAAVTGLGIAIGGFLKDDGPEKLSKSLQKNALEANRSAQALADVTQSYTAYEAAMESRDPTRMTNAMDKLLGKIFKIGDFDPSAMQSALSAIGSGDPREALATAQAAISERQAGIERNTQLFEATRQSAGFWKSGGLGKGGLADSIVSFKQGVSGKDAGDAIKRATAEIEANNIAGALQTLEGVIEGGADAIKAILEGGFGGDIGGVTEADRRKGLGQIAANLSQKAPQLTRRDEFAEALKGPALEVARTQKELAEATRLFGFELAKSSANLKIFSENASRAFSAQMEFRGQEFSSSIDALQESGRMTEREAITARGVRGSDNLIMTRNTTRNQIGVEGLSAGMRTANEYANLAGAGGRKGAGAITELFSKADALSQKGDVEGLKELFSEKSISGLALGSEDAGKAATDAIQKSGEDMIAKLGVLEADTKRMLDLNARQAELQAKLYDANLYMKSMWGKGGTQKGTRDITEAIRRIEMARAKGDLTVSQREQLAADLDVVKSESGGISYDDKLEKFNRESMNASFAEAMASGNVNNIGGQMTASTQSQIDEKINDIRARAGDGSSTSSPQADFIRRFVEVKDKGEAAFKDLEKGLTKPANLTEVKASFQAVRKESDLLAAEFAKLAKKTDEVKEAELANNLNQRDNIRKSAWQGRMKDEDDKIFQQETKIAGLMQAVERGKMASPEGDFYKKAREAEEKIKAIKETQKKDAEQKDTDNARLLLEAMKKITDIVTSPTSEGRQSYTNAEVNGAIRVVLSANDFTYEVAQAVQDAISGKTNLIVKDAVASAMKLLPKL